MKMKIRSALLTFAAAAALLVPAVTAPTDGITTAMKGFNCPRRGGTTAPVISNPASQPPAA